ncbi:permease prefix domain 1-containing protein [Saccharopolyspora sp. TS4A08]|uniref:Permease prefix domain 1-containing protein n=1 Tax=Saccharopolyspora ipomoeae TaxID=3042027 RepID=A0ABT6PWK5_9PSEU|nr:permease prefix domain 1-containing protein [Saccharopolyspora sp. TS4A08]MDI2032399.1 permease prefix domain 1-containing protein [Saccharopolyspora sp. TS4A08]
MNAIETYVDELAAELRGPARVKARMVQEIRDGLTDTVTARTDAGLPPEQAVQDAVREFGTPAEVAPSCQRELTVAQTRHTAFALLVTVPVLLGGWRLASTIGRDQSVPTSQTAQLLAAVAGTAAVVGCAVLLITRRLAVPGRLPLVLGWTGTAASIAMPLASIALATTLPPAENWPLLLLLAAGTVAAHFALAYSAKVCRECAAQVD